MSVNAAIWSFFFLYCLPVRFDFSFVILTKHCSILVGDTCKWTINLLELFHFTLKWFLISAGAAAECIGCVCSVYVGMSACFLRVCVFVYDWWESMAGTFQHGSYQGHTRKTGPTRPWKPSALVTFCSSLLLYSFSFKFALSLNQKTKPEANLKIKSTTL